MNIIPFDNRKKKKRGKSMNLKTLNKDINSTTSKNFEVNSLVNEIKIPNFENLSIKSNDKDTNTKSEKSYYIIDKNIKTSKVNEKDWIISNISLKDLFISRFHCGERKKRNIYNLLLNESMKVIMEKLDIFNIFRNICSIEYANNNLKNNFDVIKMSKECSKDLSEIIK